MNGLDEIIHQSIRLRIMAALNALPTREVLDFPRLLALTGATDGNLGAHLATLENAGYVELRKAFVGKKPRTSIVLTNLGRRAFEKHAIDLRTNLETGSPPVHSTRGAK